jgi:hypothetical protein
VHLELGDPTEIAQSHIDASPGIEQRARFGYRRQLALRFSLIAIEKKPAVSPDV